MNGGAKGDRTPDLYNAIVALSQLSYDPCSHSELSITKETCKQNFRKPYKKYSVR